MKRIGKRDDLRNQSNDYNLDEFAFDNTTNLSGRETIGDYQDSPDDEPAVGEREPSIKSIRISGVMADPLLKKASSHIIDLNQRQELIKRRGLHLFEQPKRRSSANLLSFIDLKSLRKKGTNGERVSKSVFAGSLSADVIAKQLKYAEKVTYQSLGIEEKHHTSLTTALIFGVVLAMLIIPIKTFIVGNDLYRQKDEWLNLGRAAVDGVQSGSQALASSDYAGAQADFQNANRQFIEMNRTINQFGSAISALVEMLPTVGSKVRLGRTFVEVGQSFSQAAALLTQGLSQKQPATEILLRLEDKIDGVIVALSAAQKNLSLIDINDVPADYREAVTTMTGQLPLMIDNLHQISKVNSIAHDVLGGNNLTRVLFLFQNNRELRPTGGFVGSIGLADFQKGELKNFIFPPGGAYDLEAGLKDRVDPPYALQLISDRWQLWDANWWPDFPSSANKIARFYEQSTGQTVDYVVAMNADTVVELLKAVGPIDVASFNQTLTSDNFFRVIQAEVETNYDKELNQPKRILGEASKILIAKLLEENNNLDVADVILKSLANKDVQIFSFKEDIEALLDELGWSGKLKEAPVDYLNVVSTNIAGGKSDSYVERVIDHRAEISADGTITVTTTITKTNNAPSDDPYGYTNNVDYIRVYVPENSQLIDSGGFRPPSPDLFKQLAPGNQRDADLAAVSGDTKIDDRSGTRINNELGKTVFGNWMQVEPGESSSSFFKYKLPFRIAMSSDTGQKFVNYWSADFKEIASYSLLVDTQSGVKNCLVNSTLIIDSRFAVVWSDSLENISLSVNDRVVSANALLEKPIFYSLLLANK